MNNNTTQEYVRGENPGFTLGRSIIASKNFARPITNVKETSMSLVREFLSRKVIIFMSITSLHVRLSDRFSYPVCINKN